jgi:type I restriction enzyme R subunit
MTKTPILRQVAASYGENAFVEEPTIELLRSLGWQTANLYHEMFGVDGTEGREAEHEVILKRRLRAALEKLNPGLPKDAYIQALEELTRDRSKQIPVNANRDFYRLLRDRVKVQIRDENGNPEIVGLTVIDWDNPDNNDFFFASQMWVASDMYRRRCDLVGFVNGIPLVFIELKAPHVALKSAYDDNFRDYRGQSIPQLFHPNAFIILSNGSETRVGTITSEWEHFFEWKRIADEQEQGEVSIERALRGLCDRGRLLDIVENFVAFEETKGGLVKKVAQNHQYLGVNRAIARVLELREREPEEAKQLGVFWHTQGSGKSLSMVFFTEKIHRKLPGKWTFVIVTDRQELDDQISKTYKAVGAVTTVSARATSREHLKELLTQDERYVFTLIQKFQTEKGQVYPTLSECSDIIVITDEAHRSQYDIFALNMRNALPKAGFIGFTGTPLIAGEEQRTREVFGDYVSVYDFARSVEDGATVPLFYENRIPELQLTNENLGEDMQRLLEEAELDQEQEKLIERRFARQYHLIVRPERLDAIAQDIVRHFLGRGYRGKAMMVCIDKATALSMYNRVQRCWLQEIAKLKESLTKAVEKERETLEEKIRLLETTDMAVVVSQSQNEVEDLKEKGLDIVAHRRRMLQENLDEKFKDPSSNLRLVFVCAMWITGFDVPTCSTLYLDKPIRNHTLMQTIARANRVAPGKKAGLIVDYVGIFRDLQKALAVYAQPAHPGELPIKDKGALVVELKTELDRACEFCQARGIDLGTIVATSEPFRRIKLIDDAVDALLAVAADKKDYLLVAGRVARLFKAILPDAAANEFAPLVILISYIAAKIKSLTPAPDISVVVDDIEQLSNDSIATESYHIGHAPKPEPLIDLSTIDFAALREKFASGEKRTETEKLKGQVQEKVKRMVQLNESRVDFLERFQELIKEYNAGTYNLEAFFDELVRFTEELNEEEKRGVKERLTEEELAIFDILTRPEPELSDAEKTEVKKVAKDLLAKLKAEKLVLDWREKMQARAGVQQTIRVAFRSLPTPYSPELKRVKTNLTYAHVYDSYPGSSGRSIYETTGIEM